eukprot:TRINITY_DN49_c0_g2_i1.p1 TRINITY_DN49_c0_g2~~TRINITY_DN49_c0_g2_i1.p1  ORF type:complete len:776 (+),score=246.23 TRINITY_DN49_c0_g2_i1:64-2391(+)
MGDRDEELVDLARSTTTDEVQMTLNENPEEKEQSETYEYAVMIESDPPRDKDGNKLADDTAPMVKYKEGRSKTLAFEEKMQELKDFGLIVKKQKSVDEKRTFYLFTATPERLDQEAERIELNMKLKPEHGGGYSPFLVKEKHLFQPEDERFYRFNQRMQLVRSILETSQDEVLPGAGLDMKRLVNEGAIAKFYPLHDESKKQLFREWANLKAVFKFQPLDRIRDYFGEEVALYFAWLGFYTSWLWLAAFVGLVCAIPWFRGLAYLGLNASAVLDPDEEHIAKGIWANTAYSIFLALWTTVFLEFWKRKQNTLVFLWGTQDWEDKEEERPEFQGVETPGFYWDNTWINWDDSLNKFNLTKRRYYSSIWTKSKIAGALPLVLFMCAFVVAVTYSIFVLKMLLSKIGGSNPWGGIVTAIINAISIILMNLVWKKVAVILTNWENHRTQTSYDDQLIYKVFAFQFVNSYTSLYYIAFFKAKHGSLIASPDNDPFFYSESCLYTRQDEFNLIYDGKEYPQWTYCGNELAVQLITILLTNIVVGQTQEFVLPWVMAFAKRFYMARKEGIDRNVFSQAEKEAYLSDFAGTFDEYSEMVIQYGFLTLFAAALPIAPFLAVINNMVEIRTDAARFLTATNRPHYRGATDIGTWFLILQFLSLVGVVTNCVLIGETFPTLRNILGEDQSYRPFYTLLTVVLLEHVIIGLKMLIGFLIPDVPGEVKRALAKEKFLVHETFKNSRKAEAHKNYNQRQATMRGDDDDEVDRDQVTLDMEEKQSIPGYG